MGWNFDMDIDVRGDAEVFGAIVTDLYGMMRDPQPPRYDDVKAVHDVKVFGTTRWPMLTFKLNNYKNHYDHWLHDLSVRHPKATLLCRYVYDFTYEGFFALRAGEEIGRLARRPLLAREIDALLFRST